nr:hypothetical protein GW17_00019124 [Ipomoea batatas]
MASCTVAKMNTSPEWRNPTYQNVKDNPSTPNINLWSIIPLQNLSKQEILRLQVSMHNSISVTHTHHLRYGLGHRCGGSFTVMPTRHDSVEKLAPFAKLHHQVDRLVVLVGGPELDDVGVVGEGRHYGDLAADVLDVHGGAELVLGDGLAGQGFAGGPVGAEVGDAELAPTQFPAEGVLVGDSGFGDEIF